VSTDPQSSTSTSTRGQRAFIGAAIVVFALLSAYLGLVIITRVDSIFLGPNHQITLPGGVGAVLPGVDANGDSGSKDRINILVMGLDRRSREGNIPTRTDSLFVVSVDPKTNTAGILGIPRDLWVEIPGKTGGTYQERINTVYVQGETQKYPQGGVGLMKQVLLDQFGIKIDKYVIIDLKGFETIIDDLGGIDIDVPEAVYDPYYSETELPGDYFPVDVKPGMQHMDGKTALAYARVRFNTDDLDRIQRQQRVIFAAIERAKSLNVLKNAVSLWDKYKGAVQTDVSDIEIPKYAILAADVKDTIHGVSLGPATYPYTTPGGAEVLLWNKDKAQQIVDSVFSDQSSVTPEESPTPAPVNVEVQNGTGSDGLAKRVVTFMVGNGYPVAALNFSNALDDTVHAKSEIIDVDGANQRNGYLIAKMLGIPVENYRKATASEKAALSANGTAIVIILGTDKDYDQMIQSPTTSTPGG
jgi:LCP family protein required for cell wall assembly